MSVASNALRRLGFAGLVVASSCSNVSGASTTTAQTCITNPQADGGDPLTDDGDAGAATCKPGDTDGILGGCYAFALTVDDTGFRPLILKAQNLGQVTLKIANKGTRPHDFVVGCLPTPNLEGCPGESCFPAAANVTSIVPGATATAAFVTPNPEGIYTFRSDVAGDSQVDADGGASGLWGQFVIQ